jgi:phosphoglycerate dehydrogenase-like enzyme
MNILIISEFPDSVMALIREATPGATIHYYPSGRLGDVPAEVLAQTNVLYTAGELPTPGAAPGLKWVQVHWAGVDQIIDHPLFAQGRSGVRLTTASGVHAVTISEYILMMMLALAHRMPASFGMLYQGYWSRDQARFMPQELYGATAGVIGYGAIGRRTAALCRALGMRVLAMRRGSPGRALGATEGITFYARHQLDKLLAESDYVVLTAPLTPDTYHLIDARTLASMKPSAFLINIARGDIVDEPALITALREGRLAGAALDVFAREPLPDDSPLWQMDNVILTPHIAGITPRYMQRAGELFAENLRRFTSGQALNNQVDFGRGY